MPLTLLGDRLLGATPLGTSWNTITTPITVSSSASTIGAALSSIGCSVPSRAISAL